MEQAGHRRQIHMRMGTFVNTLHGREIRQPLSSKKIHGLTMRCCEFGKAH
jgi:hypothetical protein